MKQIIIGEEFEKRAKELVAKMTIQEKMAQLKHDAPAIERLGIPAYNWWNECLHGVGRAGAATVFPQPIGMAASFNKELLHEVAVAVSDEARAKYNQFIKFGNSNIYQGLTFWSPNINIFRDPRWGRGHETYGEDPYLTGTMGTEYIKGLQYGDDLKYRKLDSTIKHYAVHSGPESERHGFNSVVSEKDLEETYLWAFKYCIQNANPSSIMGAYNAINGEPSCASETYMTKKLYEEFGFKGYYTSDCGAICDISDHMHNAKNRAEAAALALNTGCQLNCGNAYEWLKVAFAENLVSEETITEAVEVLFAARFRLGMFDDDCIYDKIPYNVVECKKHRDLNLKMTEESIVLLKNDGILPIKNVKSIAIIGPNANSELALLGNYNGRPTRISTPLSGIIEYADENGIEIMYTSGCHIYEDRVKEIDKNLVREAIVNAKNADLVIMCMGLDSSMEGEAGDAFNADNGGDKVDLELPFVQRKLFDEIAKIGKPIVFVNITGSAINLSKQDEICSAVLQCFYTGAETGKALANILFGKVSPSGRLPVTFYKSVDDLPDFKDYSMENRTYKFFKGDVVYPFGFGLTYSNIEENWINKNTVEIINNGEFDTDYSVLKFEYIPHKSLCGYKKVFIKKGETIKIKF